MVLVEVRENTRSLNTLSLLSGKVDLKNQSSFSYRLKRTTKATTFFESICRGSRNDGRPEPDSTSTWLKKTPLEGAPRSSKKRIGLFGEGSKILS